MGIVHVCHCALACAKVVYCIKGTFLIASTYWTESALIFKLGAFIVSVYCRYVRGLPMQNSKFQVLCGLYLELEMRPLC